MDVKKDILASLKSVYKNSGLPRNLAFEYADNVLHMKLKKEAVTCNMQEDRAAFEGWAVTIKTYWNKGDDYKIMLWVPELKDNFPNPEDVFLRRETNGSLKGKGHYGRFLYRAWHFSREYDWFLLSEDILKAVKIYRAVITSFHCRNHLPKDDAGINAHPEIRAEFAFSKHPEEIETLSGGQVKGKVYRQLNCWLESDDGKIQFLTAGKSAMDLWNITNKTLNIFELKAGEGGKRDNYKVGMISELFFYAQYCNNMFGKDAIFFKRPISSEGRGYELLAGADIDNIKAYFLTNHYHPLITDETVGLLNKNKSGIKFIRLPEYDFNHMMSLE